MRQGRNRVGAGSRARRMCRDGEGKQDRGTPDVQRRGHLDAPGSVQGISHSTGLLYLSAPDLMRATGMMMWDLRLGLALSQSGQRAKKHGTPPLPV